MLLPRNSLPALDLGSLGPVEDKEREKWHTHEAYTPEEEHSQFRILPFSSISSMKEPDGCIDSNAKTPKIGRIPLESVLDSQVGERLQFSGGSKNLQVSMNFSIETAQCAKGAHIPKASYPHPVFTYPDPVRGLEARG